MVGGKHNRGAQQPRIDKFTRPRETRGQAAQDQIQGDTAPLNQEQMQPSLMDIMVALQSIRGALETKMDSISSEITLLRARLQENGRPGG